MAHLLRVLELSVESAQNLQLGRQKSFKRQPPKLPSKLHLSMSIKNVQICNQLQLDENWQLLEQQLLGHSFESSASYAWCGWCVWSEPCPACAACGRCCFQSSRGLGCWKTSWKWRKLGRFHESPGRYCPIYPFFKLVFAYVCHLERFWQVWEKLRSLSALFWAFVMLLLTMFMSPGQRTKCRRSHLPTARFFTWGLALFSAMVWHTTSSLWTSTCQLRRRPQSWSMPLGSTDQSDGTYPKSWAFLRSPSEESMKLSFLGEPNHFPRKRSTVIIQNLFSFMYRCWMFHCYSGPHCDLIPTSTAFSGDSLFRGVRREWLDDLWGSTTRGAPWLSSCVTSDDPDVWWRHPGLGKSTSWFLSLSLISSSPLMRLFFLDWAWLNPKRLKSVMHQ